MSEAVNGGGSGQNPNGPRKSMNDMARQITKGNKVAGIVVAILMIVLGVLFFIFPIRTDMIVAAIATIGFVVYGIYQLIVYFRTPSGYRNGWTCANGIIFIILGVLLILSGPVSRLETFTFLLGFLAIFGGIMQISSHSALKKAGEQHTGLVLASGIINLILGIFLIIAPLAAAWAMAYVLGIYLIVGGIAFFAESASGHMGRKV